MKHISVTYLWFAEIYNANDVVFGMKQTHWLFAIHC